MDEFLHEDQNVFEILELSDADPEKKFFYLDFEAILLESLRHKGYNC